MYRLLLIATFLTFTAALYAENVYLRDGRIVSGRITNQTRTDITIATPQGVIKIQKDQIRRIQYDTGTDEKAQEEARKAEERRRLEEYNRQQEEMKRRQEEQRRQEEARKAEEQRKTEQQKAEADKRLADQKKTEEDKRKQEEARKREEENRRREAEARDAGPTWYGAFVRSLVLPGWGQYYSGRKTTGYMMGCGFLVAGGLMLREQSAYDRNRSAYAETTRGFLLGTPFVARSLFNVSQTDGQAYYWFFAGSGQTGATRERMELHAKKLSALKTGVAVFYAWNIVDVILFRPTTTTKVGMGADENGYRLAFTSHF